MHIKQALKLLLPREYISRCRQKRHWASKYLPGKEPVNPKHDIFKYCDVALKFMQEGKTKYQIGRVEAMESTEDGSEVISFHLKSKASVRIRCSLYSRDENDLYFVSDDVLLTNWKYQSSIIGTVDLQLTPLKQGKYTLHPASKENLLKLGILPYNVIDDNHLDNEDESQICTSSREDEEFFEVEDVIGRRLSKECLCYEYKVCFKGYGSEDDMWLPASFFNRAVQFESISKFGRKRKHTVDPENVIEDCKRRKSSATKLSTTSGSGIRRESERDKKAKRGRTTKATKPDLSPKTECTSQKSDEKEAVSQKGQEVQLKKRRKQSNVCRDKGKLFRSCLATSPVVQDTEWKRIKTSPSIQNTSAKEPILVNDGNDGQHTKFSSSNEVHINAADSSTASPKSTMIDSRSDNEKIPNDPSLVADEECPSISCKISDATKAVSFDVITVEDFRRKKKSNQEMKSW